MQVTRKQERVIRQALDHWQQSGELSAQQHQQLESTLQRLPFDWKRLSRYAFWIAIACLIIAAVNLFSDTALIHYLIELFSISEIMRVVFPALIAGMFYFWGFKRQRKEILWHYSTEFILFLGILFTAVFLWQLGELLDDGSGNIAPLLLMGCIIYGVIGSYWLGMNYPIRFVLFGSALLAGCYFLQNILMRRRLFFMTKIMGLSYLFIALWIMSIFGNYDPDTWYYISSVQLLPWALLFAVVAVICIYISLKTDDGMLRGFGLTFLGINLYTRFFEYFWNSLHSAIFFFILAISLIFIGRKAEKIWHAIENSRMVNKQ